MGFEVKASGRQKCRKLVPAKLLPSGFGMRQFSNRSTLGGSGVVISGVLSPLIWVISIVTLLIALLITTLNPKPYRTLKGTLNPL